MWKPHKIVELCHEGVIPRETYRDWGKRLSVEKVLDHLQEVPLRDKQIYLSILETQEIKDSQKAKELLTDYLTTIQGEGVYILPQVAKIVGHIGGGNQYRQLFACMMRGTKEMQAEQEKAIVNAMKDIVRRKYRLSDRLTNIPAQWAHDALPLKIDQLAWKLKNDPAHCDAKLLHTIRSCKKKKSKKDMTVWMMEQIKENKKEALTYIDILSETPAAAPYILEFFNREAQTSGINRERYTVYLHIARRMASTQTKELLPIFVVGITDFFPTFIADKNNIEGLANIGTPEAARLLIFVLRSPDIDKYETKDLLVTLSSIKGLKSGYVSGETERDCAWYEERAQLVKICKRRLLLQLSDDAVLQKKLFDLLITSSDVPGQDAEDVLEKMEMDKYPHIAKHALEVWLKDKKENASIKKAQEWAKIVELSMGIDKLLLSLFVQKSPKAFVEHIHYRMKPTGDYDRYAMKSVLYAVQARDSVKACVEYLRKERKNENESDAILGEFAVAKVDKALEVISSSLAMLFEVYQGYKAHRDKEGIALTIELIKRYDKNEIRRMVVETGC